MNKKIISLLLSLLLLNVNNLYAYDYDIYGYKFPLDELKYLQDDLVNIKVSADKQDDDGVIIKKSEIKFYIFNTLINLVGAKDFYKICNEECLLDIFKRSFIDKKFDLSSISYVMLVNRSQDDNFAENAENFLNDKSKDEQTNFYKHLLKITLKKDISDNQKVIDVLSKYAVKLALDDDTWVVTNVLNFLIKNKDSIQNEFDKLIKEYALEDNAILLIDNAIKLEGKLLGFSNLSYQKNFTDFNKAKYVLQEIDNLKNVNEMQNIPLSLYSDLGLYDLVEQKYIQKLYKLVKENLEAKDFKNALDALLLLPENKTSERTFENLKNIFDNSPSGVNLLKNADILKLSKILKHNNWLETKIIKFEEKHIRELVRSRAKREDIFNEFGILLKLRPDIDIGNDKLRILLAWYAMINKDHKLSDDILSSIGNNFVYFLSPKGIFLFCKKYLWIFFALVTTVIFSYILIFKANLRTSKKNLGGKFDDYSQKEVKLEDDVTIEKEIRYKSLLEFFGIKDINANLNDIKSEYRKKIKKIHPDIIGKETKEFLEVQEKYKKLIKLYDEIYK